jgi:hypothetical protein
LEHGGVELLNDFAGVSFEDFFDDADVVEVVGFGLEADAGAGAFLDVVLEAEAEFVFADVVGGEEVLAGADGVEGGEELEEVFDGEDGGVGAVVVGFVGDSLSGEEDAGEGFVGDDDPGVGFVVFEEDVVAGLMFFNKVVFEQKGVFFGFYDEVSDVADFPEHDAGFGVFLGFVEIGEDAFFEVLGFADVDDGVAFVEIHVHAGAFR